MFLRHEDFASVVRFTPLIAIDLIVENTRGEFLLGQRTNRPARGYWFVPGGRVQKDESLVLGFRLRVSENDLQLPDVQHDAYRWLAIEEILASDHVHGNSRSYFCEKSQAGAPGL